MPLIQQLSAPVKNHLGVIATCLLWYAVSSVSSQVTKTILNEFPFPLALGECQFLIVSALCLATMIIIHNTPRLRRWFPPGSAPPPDNTPFVRPSKHLLATVLPLSCFQFLGKLFSHSATALVPISTVAGVKTLSPLLLVASYRVLYHVHFPLSTYLALLPLIAGILLIVLADTKDTLITTTASDRYIGILYAALSLFVFVGQNIYGKTVLTYNQKHVNDHAELALAHNTENNRLRLPLTSRDEDKEIETSKRDLAYELEAEKSNSLSHLPTSFPKIRNKYDKLTILLYCSALGALLSLPWFLYIEAPQFLQKAPSPDDPAQPHVVTIPWKLLLINGSSHFLQSLIVFHLLGAIPAVSYSIASMMKKITIIVVSMIYTGHTVSHIQLLGLLLTASGLYSYDRWGGN